jgi:hypothetical protein
MSGKGFKLEQIAQCVRVLDELAASGLGAQAFAQARGLSYTQLRAWRNHEARWRARLAGGATPRLQTSASGFVQVQVAAATGHGSAPSPSPAPAHAHAQPHSIRIDCVQAGGGARSAVVHWPVQASAQCALWLSAYLA